MEVKEEADTKKVQEGFQPTEGTTGLVQLCTQYLISSLLVQIPVQALASLEGDGQETEGPGGRKSQRQH